MTHSLTQLLTHSVSSAPNVLRLFISFPDDADITKSIKTNNLYTDNGNIWENGQVKNSSVVFRSLYDEFEGENEIILSKICYFVGQR